jgi:tRNA-specific 2-thiouridylase
MSGGVDSAVAAARAPRPGHDVTGIHLALSRNPQSYRTGARGCCTIEDSNDARRAADVIGIPFYVWDLSDRFHEDVVEDFMAEYSAGTHPQPVPALQREDQVRGGARPAMASASTRWRPATTPSW